MPRLAQVTGINVNPKRLLAHTLAAHGAVLAAVAVFSTGLRHELAPGEDQGTIYIITKAPQYAGVGYTTPYLAQIGEVLGSMPEYQSSFMHVGGVGRGQNEIFGDAILKEWSERTRSATQVQRQIQAVGNTLDGVALTAVQPPPTRFEWWSNFHDHSYDVIPQVRGSDRMTPADLGRLYVKTSSGTLVPLSTVTRIEMRPQVNQLTQFGQMNSATLEALPAPRVIMGEAVAFLQSEPLPIGTSVDWLSDSRQFVQEGNRLLVSFAFALVISLHLVRPTHHLQFYRQRPSDVVSQPSGAGAGVDEAV